MMNYSVFIWQIRGFSQSGTGQRVVKQKHWIMVGACCSYLFLKSFNFLSDVCHFNLRQYFIFFNVSIYIVCFEFNSSNFKIIAVIGSFVCNSCVLSLQATLHSNNRVLGTG